MFHIVKTTVLLNCLLLTSTALADEVVITYRSGTVQQVPLLEPTEQIQHISYRKQDAVRPPAAATPPVPAAPQVTAPHQQPGTSTPKATAPSAPEPKATTEKIPIKLKWAQPKDSW